jgi:hypothetical protein
MQVTSELEQALAKLAKSVRGKQGVGVVKSLKVAVRLFQMGLARPVRSEDENVCSVTLEGFRYLEARRNGVK